MSNVYRFIYDSEKGEGFGACPEATTIKTRHYFEDGITWVPILWQFAKFLESTGYVGVTDRIIIKDPYGIEEDKCLFETLGPNQCIVDVSEETDEEVETVKPGTAEWNEAMKGVEDYLGSLNENEKADLHKQGYNV